ncbi:hypothetical protein PR048_028696 [Dryococelus australis]|uniref:Uncharacterized protein n=1 Tax=Dryococelus australis TaxID=614101 RepID=A0ABQ9GF59_9NEOP|nr:hypothetical protein PR048_028696 [Dryococelus australis]
MSQPESFSVPRKDIIPAPHYQRKFSSDRNKGKAVIITHSQYKKELREGRSQTPDKQKLMNKEHFVFVVNNLIHLLRRLGKVPKCKRRFTKAV